MNTQWKQRIKIIALVILIVTAVIFVFSGASANWTILPMIISGIVYFFIWQSDRKTTK